MQTSESTHSGGYAREISVLPGIDQGCAGTYCTAVYHATRHGNSRGELEPLPLQSLVYLADVVQLVAPFGGSSPGLDAFEDLGANVVVNSGWADGFQQGGEIVHKLSRRDFDQEVLSPVLDARICELCGGLASGGYCWRWGIQRRSKAYV